MPETISAETSVLAPKRLYLAALAVFAVVLGGYCVTLAPTVTFWDAGELIATAKILGIPHPPGTPLFVLLANVWGTWFPFGEFASRTNLMTATFSAAAAALFFLVIAWGLAGWGELRRDEKGQRGQRGQGGQGGQRRQGSMDPVFVVGGAAAAALVSAFTFTVWQNSNETEVYMVSTFSIAFICWLAWLWRKHRGTERAAHLLLLIVYLGAVSVGNHLMTLLVGPALVVFLWHVLQTEPLDDPGDRRVEWAQWFVVVGVWALLIGTGLGDPRLLVLGGGVFVVAAIYAATAGGLRFAVTVLIIAAVGASTYFFLYLRAKVGPYINEADPSTWENLIAVIRREQYPPRSPLDNPIWPSGPQNPGRSLNIIYWQLINYLQYFDWQWANGLAATEPVFAKVRLPFTLAFTSLGIFGLSQLAQRDRSLFWLLFILFLTTGPVLMGYMNFKPGFSLAWDTYPGMEMHEVRERDYFFTVSFQAWGLFAGVGIAGLYAVLRRSVAQSFRRPVVPGAIFLLAVLPFALNFSAASRRHGPAVTLARDFAYNLLQSVEPYAILITNGDNDTFPLWYLQEVEGIRQDVVVVNLSLANTDWYLRQLRDNPARRFVSEQAPWFAHLAPDTVPPLRLSWSDADIQGLRSFVLPRASVFRAGQVEVTLPDSMPLYIMNIVTLQLIRENWRHRPVYFAMTAGTGSWLGMDRHLTQEGLAFKLNAQSLPQPSWLAPGIFGTAMNVPRTEMLVNQVYRYAGLFGGDTLRLDPTSQNIATNLSFVFYGLGQAYELMGRREESLTALRKGFRLHPLAQVQQMLDAAEQPILELGDTGLAPLPSPVDTGR